ncbi:MAG: hypothetical protein V7K67_23655 [Nostoc sp.]|uniref:hypothetical protein n=1 Tax=Nostoc sp. TaxID=1180 RepID=UPI002FFB74AC
MIKNLSPKKGRGLLCRREDFVFPLQKGFEAPNFIYEEEKRFFSETLVQARKKVFLLNHLNFFMGIDKSPLPAA